MSRRRGGVRTRRGSCASGSPTRTQRGSCVNGTPTHSTCRTPYPPATPKGMRKTDSFYVRFKQKTAERGGKAAKVQQKELKQWHEEKNFRQTELKRLAIANEAKKAARLEKKREEAAHRRDAHRHKICLALASEAAEEFQRRSMARARRARLQYEQQEAALQAERDKLRARASRDRQMKEARIAEKRARALREKEQRAAARARIQQRQTRTRLEKERRERKARQILKAAAEAEAEQERERRLRITSMVEQQGTFLEMEAYIDLAERAAQEPLEIERRARNMAAFAAGKEKTVSRVDRMRVELAKERNRQHEEKRKFAVVEGWTHSDAIDNEVERPVIHCNTRNLVAKNKALLLLDMVEDAIAEHRSDTSNSSDCGTWADAEGEQVKAAARPASSPVYHAARALLRGVGPARERRINGAFERTAMPTSPIVRSHMTALLGLSEEDCRSSNTTLLDALLPCEGDSAPVPADACYLGPTALSPTPPLLPYSPSFDRSPSCGRFRSFLTSSDSQSSADEDIIPASSLNLRTLLRLNEEEETWRFRHDDWRWNE